ncbi:MAG: hypothetical protein WCJ06_17670, partial [Planctomycetota bacterium]
RWCYYVDDGPCFVRCLKAHGLSSMGLLFLHKATHPAQWDGLENILQTSTDRSLMTHPAQWDGLKNI